MGSTKSRMGANGDWLPDVAGGAHKISGACSRFRIASVSILVGLVGAGLLTSSGRGDEKDQTQPVTVGPVVYQIPKSWEREQPRNPQMRVLQYAVPLAKGDDGKCELVVFYFGGQGGSVEDNISRWVDMFADKEAKEKVENWEVSRIKVTALDITGTYKDRPAPFAPNVTLRRDWRMLAAVVETPQDGPYFFRMVGPKKTVGEHVGGWTRMLRTLEGK